ncbi:MAG: CapA family protein [Nostocaceae cyanobacterium]|nr:CapA family protein [Nostocaceae cyanobacterium]
MVNRWLVLSCFVISFSFGLGIRIGKNIRLGEISASDVAIASTNPSSNQIQAIPVSSPAPAFRLSQEIDSPEPEFLPTPTIEDYTLSDTITIQAVGDVIPGTNFPNYRLPRDKNQLLPKSVRAYLARADILFGNFETSLTNHPYSAKDIGRGQIFAFRSPPSYAQLFADVGFDVFNIANNHALDFGVVGFRDTVNNLNSVGIETLGHKNQILYFGVNNATIAMIGFAPYNSYNSLFDLEAAKALVKTAKSQANIVIVSMHAGAEGTGALNVKNKTEFFYGENRGNSIKFARTVIDAGADLVLGHGPHVPRAMEIYKGKLIAYSLGNFIGYRTLSTQAETGYSMILEVKLNSQGDLVGGQVIPVRLNKQGIPYIDQRFRTVALLRYLIKNDFPNNQVEIDKDGKIVVN